MEIWRKKALEYSFEIANLKMEIIDLKEAIRHTPEWIDSPGGGNASCPICGGYRYYDGHSKDCIRLKL